MFVSSFGTLLSTALNLIDRVAGKLCVENFFNAEEEVGFATDCRKVHTLCSKSMVDASEENLRVRGVNGCYQKLSGEINVSQENYVEPFLS